MIKGSTHYILITAENEYILYLTAFCKFVKPIDFLPLTLRKKSGIWTEAKAPAVEATPGPQY
jgi:hypothetical protein